MAKFLTQLGPLIRTNRATSNGIFHLRLSTHIANTSPSLADSSRNQDPSNEFYNLRDACKCNWFDFPPDHHQLHSNLYDPSDFNLYPYFLTSEEQAAVLHFCLSQLDKLNRPRRRKFPSPTDREVSSLSGKLKDDEDYVFEPGHFDNVISGYREMLLNQQKIATDPSDLTFSSVKATLSRLQALMPSSTSQPLIHILHLSSEGKIDPHIDNLGTSGSTIIGLSLGSARVMRLGHESAPIDSHIKVLLPPGSAYIQHDSVRYNLQHSIPKQDVFKNQVIGGQQRLSLMLRNPIQDKPVPTFK